ncbi:MAG: efflux RND transporter periplasmic adaptor subunit [Kiritimatiellae bacterium]|nr:efflux RND transporter periplasmic adaptor subunit [Kiritimatiellia bacterium]
MKKITIIILVLLVLGGAVLLRSCSARGHDHQAAAHVEDEVAFWTCSMHPQIRQPKPGQCPLCGMDLIPVRTEGEQAGGSARGLTLSPAAAKLAEIETAPAVREFVTSELRLVGKVMPDETRIRDVALLSDGVVERLHVNYAGVAVRRGEHLAEIYSPDVLTAAKELLIARDAGVVQSGRHKLQLLGVTDPQIEEILSTGKAPKTYTVYSPIDGVVTMMGGREGAWLDRGASLARIVDLSAVWVLLDAYESDMPFVRYGQQVEFTVEALPGRTFSGSVSFIPPELDEMTRTVKVRLNVPNPAGALRPGMFVRAAVRGQVTADGSVIHPELAGKWISPMHPEIVKDAPGTCDICGMPLVSAESLGLTSETPAKPPLVIPATAPLVTGKRAVVYVAVPGKQATYEGRDIELGPRAGDHYVVMSGLSEGDLVVVSGNFKIDSAVQILGKPSMMSPEGGEPVSGHAQHGAMASVETAMSPEMAGGHEGHAVNMPGRPQTVCPVMGGAINQDFYADHDGYRVYFCCGACHPEFAKDPGKYVKQMLDAGVELERTPKGEPGH